MPSSNILSALGGSGPVSEQALKNLRLILVSHRAEGDRNNQLTSDQLTDFRIMTGVRLAYALTTGKVAGAVCQTNPYDYRGQRGFSHFGPPLNSVEVKLVDYDEKSGNEKAIEGKVRTDHKNNYATPFSLEGILIIVIDPHIWTRCGIW